MEGPPRRRCALMSREARYVKRRYSAPAAWHDQLCAELLVPDLLGIESAGEEIFVYYRHGAVPDGALGREWLDRDVRLLEQSEIVEEDWLKSYRALAQPAPLGDAFWVDPREPQRRVEVPDGRELLRLPARRAFGTGSHESTRLAVSWLEDLNQRVSGSSVLDLGSGSGVLSFVCDRLGAARVVGVEIELESALLAGLNRGLNGGDLSLVAGTLECVMPEARFDCAVANILLAHVLPLLPAVAGHLRVPGCLVLSGALATEARSAESAFAAMGLEVQGVKAEGRWVAWHLEKGNR